MALTSRKRYPNRISRRKIPGVGAETDRPRRQEIIPDTVAITSATSVTMSFDQPVSLSGLPGYVLGTAGGPVAITTASLNSSRDTLTIIHETGTLTSVVVPFEDPAVRNIAGGYVRPGIYTPEA